MIPSFLARHLNIATITQKMNSQTAQNGFIVTSFVGATMAVRFISNIILTNLLAPYVFGIMKIIQSIQNIIVMFTDLGISTKIVQDQDESPSFLNAAWTLSVIQKGFIYIILLSLAYPISVFYNEPNLIAYLPVTGLGIFIMGFLPTRYFLYQKHQQLFPITVIQFVAYLIGVGGMIGLAHLHASVWAIIIGGLFMPVIQVLASWRYLKGITNRFYWNKKYFKVFISFGVWITIASLCTSLYQQFEFFYIGKIITLQILGIYAIANTFATIPTVLADHMQLKIFFPKISKLLRSNTLKPIWGQRAVFQCGLMLINLGVLLGATGLISLVYDERYQLAKTFLVFLYISVQIQLILKMTSASILGRGLSKVHMVRMLINSLIIGTCIIIGFKVSLDIKGILIGKIVADFLVYGVALIFAKYVDGLYWPSEILDCGMALVTATIGLSLYAVIY